jgi:hypothetical protein
VIADSWHNSTKSLKSGGQIVAAELLWESTWIVEKGTRTLVKGASKSPAGFVVIENEGPAQITVDVFNKSAVDAGSSAITFDLTGDLVIEAGSLARGKIRLFEVK